MKVIVQKLQPKKVFEPFSVKIEFENFGETQTFLDHLNASIEELEFHPSSLICSVRKHIEQELKDQFFIISSTNKPETKSQY